MGADLGVDELEQNGGADATQPREGALEGGLPEASRHVKDVPWGKQKLSVKLCLLVTQLLFGSWSCKITAMTPSQVHKARLRKCIHLNLRPPPVRAYMKKDQRDLVVTLFGMGPLARSFGWILHAFHRCAKSSLTTHGWATKSCFSSFLFGISLRKMEERTGKDRQREVGIEVIEVFVLKMGKRRERGG